MRFKNGRQRQNRRSHIESIAILVVDGRLATYPAILIEQCHAIPAQPPVCKPPLTRPSRRRRHQLLSSVYLRESLSVSVSGSLGDV
jgi:hypothetical protein